MFIKVENYIIFFIIHFIFNQLVLRNHLIYVLASGEGRKLVHWVTSESGHCLVFWPECPYRQQAWSHNNAEVVSWSLSNHMPCFSLYPCLFPVIPEVIQKSSIGHMVKLTVLRVKVLHWVSEMRHSSSRICCFGSN